ncbi:MAG TPA: hypothetical protein DCF68_03055 [Cyanothece sp. UBA12306]|nr:hypothetical protein [Cyanothece sp. UBA12306]
MIRLTQIAENGTIVLCLSFDFRDDTPTKNTQGNNLAKSISRLGKVTRDKIADFFLISKVSSQVMIRVLNT